MRTITTVKLAAACLATACAATPPPSVRYQEYRAWTAPRLTSAEVPLDDGQIAEIADAIDVQQIETARLARDRSAHSEVRAFADELIADQQAERAMLGRLYRERIGLQPSVLVEKLESDERPTRAWLSSDGASFDRDFLESEIKEQTRERDWLDHVLLPGVHDAGLERELWRRRTLASQRIAEARRLGQRFARSP